MVTVLESDSPSLHIVLERIDCPGHRPLYILSIKPMLFAKHTLIRRWGRIGSLGR